MNIYDEPTDRGGPRKVLCCASLFGGGGGGRGGRRKKKRKKMTNAPRFNDLSAKKGKKGGIEVGGIEIAFDGLPLFLSFFFFFLTLDEEQNFACN